MYQTVDGDYEDLDDYAHHAPTECVWRSRQEREERRKRDLNELQDLWREERLARQREAAPTFYRRTSGRKW